MNLNNDLSHEEKESLKSMNYDWHETYENYNPRVSPKETTDIVRVGKSLIREPCENNSENTLLISIIEYLLEEKLRG